MAEHEPDIYGLLHGFAAVAAIVGTHIYPDAMAEATALPAIRYQTIDQLEDSILDDGSSSGLFRRRVQIDCVAKKKSDAVALAQAVRDALDGFSGVVAAVPAASPLLTVYVNNVLRNNVLDDYEPERKTYRRILDFTLLYN